MIRNRRQRRRQLAAAAVFIALLLGVTTAAVAWAHAELIGSEPADGSVVDVAPDRVRVHFSEPIDPEFLGLEVYASDRSRVDVGGAHVSPTDVRVLETAVRDAGPGTYTAVWRVVSLDSHVVRGVFAYTVGAGAAPGRPLDLALPATGAPFAVEATARWATFLGLFVLLGGFAFRPLILGPAVGESRRNLVELATHRWLPLAWAALAVLLVVAFASLVFQASSAAGVPLTEVLGGRAVTRLLTATKFGYLWLARVGLLIAIAGVLTWIIVAHGPRLAWWLGAVLTAGALLTLSMTGHASAVQERVVLSVAADWAHLLAGGVWVGGLVQLAFALPPILRAADTEARRELLGRLVPRFSWLAGASVGVLILSGLYASLSFVPSWSALGDTIYGAWLSGKLLLVAPLLLLGLVNLLVLHPRFRRGLGAGRRFDDPGARRAFRWTVFGEVVLAVAVLAATSALTGVPPASSLQLEARPFEEVRQLPSGASVRLVIRPNQAGDNRIEVEALNRGLQPLTDVERVQLTLTMLDMQMGQREVQAQPSADPGEFEVTGNALSMPGQWQADVSIRRGGMDEAAQFGFVVGEPPGLNQPPFSPGRIVYLALVEPGREAGSIPISPRAVLALVALGAGVFLLTRLVSLGRRANRRSLQLAAGAFLLLGLGLGGVRMAEAYRLSLPNPEPATAQSLARGQEVYETVGCASCHGLSGRGDGPEGRLLRPRPADFRTHLAAGHTDRELFDWISNGVSGTAMPPFRDTLSEEDRWHVINYIRTFAAPAGGG